MEFDRQRSLIAVLDEIQRLLTERAANLIALRRLRDGK